MKITFEIATQDDCLDRMVPSDLRVLVAQRDRLQARVAAQQSALNSICTCSWGAAEFFDVGKAASWMQKIAYDALDEIPSTEAFFLRKQAEAVQASRRAASVPGWIKCSDRLPAEYDGDFEGLVWVNDRDMTLPKYAQSRVHWSRVRGIAGYTHWMPTGFRRPQPPKQEGE